MVKYVCDNLNSGSELMRKRRNKSPNYKYHVRVRGLDEVPLFRDDEDKQKYIDIIESSS